MLMADAVGTVRVGEFARGSVREEGPADPQGELPERSRRAREHVMDLKHRVLHQHRYLKHNTAGSNILQLWMYSIKSMILVPIP